MGCRASSHAPSNLSVERVPPLNELKPFVPAVDAGKVVKVSAGDIIVVGAPISMNGTTQYFRFRVRLRGIQCSYEKEQARVARDALRTRLMGQVVDLSAVRVVDKRGRLLAAVLHNGECMSAWMLARGMAVPDYND